MLFYHCSWSSRWILLYTSFIARDLSLWKGYLPDPTHTSQHRYAGFRVTMNIEDGRSATIRSGLSSWPWEYHAYLEPLSLGDLAMPREGLRLRDRDTQTGLRQESTSPSLIVINNNSPMTERNAEIIPWPSYDHGIGWGLLGWVGAITEPSPMTLKCRSSGDPIISIGINGFGVLIPLIL